MGVGMEDRTMMHPEMWRRHLKPRLAKEIAAARDVQLDIPVWYHSDGDITLIIDDLVEVRVTVLNPVQPDIYELKHRYDTGWHFGARSVRRDGDAVWTPQEIKWTVKRMIEFL